jgi:hypothetical protein
MKDRAVIAATKLAIHVNVGEPGIAPGILEAFLASNVCDFDSGAVGGTTTNPCPQDVTEFIARIAEFATGLELPITTL